MNPILNIVRSIRCLFQSVKTIERYHQIYTFHSYIPDFYNFTPNCPFAVALPPPKTILSAKKNERHLRLNSTPLYIRIAPVAINKWWRNKFTERKRERGSGGSSGGSKETVSQVDALRKRKSHYRETKVGRLIIIIGVSLRAAARLARGGNAG